MNSEPDPTPPVVVNHRVADQFDAFLLAVWKPPNGKLQSPERKPHEPWNALIKQLGGAQVDPDARDLLELKLLPFVVSALADHLPGVDRVVAKGGLSLGSVARLYSLWARRAALEDKGIVDEEFPERVGELLRQERLSVPRATPAAAPAIVNAKAPPKAPSGAQGANADHERDLEAFLQGLVDERLGDDNDGDPEPTLTAQKAPSNQETTIQVTQAQLHEMIAKGVAQMSLFF